MLDAAEALIERDGPEVTMADLAAASDVTKPSLYRSIGDRNALVAALAARFSDRVNAAVVADLDPDDDAAARVRSVMRGYFKVVDRHRNLFVFVSGDSLGTDRPTQALDIADISVGPLARTLRRAGATPADATAWSYAVVGAAQFATFRWLRDGQQTPDEAADQLTDLLWSGIDAAASRRRPDEEGDSNAK
jgi:AcrR family transcriptional regulator